MKLVFYLLIIRYMLRIVPASYLGGAIIMEDLKKDSETRKPEEKSSDETPDIL